MEEKSLKTLLKEQMVLDGYQFYETACFKIASSKMSYRALERLDKIQSQVFHKNRENMFEELKQTGRVGYVPPKDTVDYFGEDVSRHVVIEKLVIEIFGSLHSFFDILAQLINAVLYANDGVYINRVSFNRVVEKIDQFKEYSGDYIERIKKIEADFEYKFIGDFNNTVKHRRQINIGMKFEILKGEKELTLSSFEKDKREYEKEDLLGMVGKCIDYCEVLLQETITFVQLHFTNSKHKHVEGRLYNPNTSVFFETEDDFNAFRNPKNSMHYIIIDDTKPLISYRVMLIAAQENDKEISMYNCPYNHIVVKNKNEKFIGLLKPKDQEKITLEDGRRLMYREYIFEEEEPEIKYFDYVLDPKINVYPYLSNCEISYLPNKEV